MICISVISHGQAAVAAPLLERLATDESGLISQVIYTRNIPEPRAPEPPATLPGLAVIDNTQPRGFGANHNAAFALCRAPYFCVLNPDITWTKTPFPPLLACLQDSDRQGPLGLVAPLVRSPNGRIENSARALYTPVELLRQKLAPTNEGGSPAWLAGMFMLFRSDAYGQIDGFNERFFLYIEDVEVCSRLQLKGWGLAQCQHAEVVHDARNASHRSLRHAAWHLGGMIRYWSSPAFWAHRSRLRQAKSGPATERR